MNLYWLRLTGLTLALSLNSYLARAQTFEPGYLVTSRGDTLRGEVENAFWSDPPTSVRFRTGSAAAISSYRARQLRAVQLASGRLLRRELLPIDYSARKNTSELTHGLVSRQQPDSVLADVLVEGAATLLSAAPAQVQHFFVRREGQPYLELTERLYLDNDGSGARIRDGNNYRGQLNQYFGDCLPAVEAADRAQFNAPDIIGVVQAYNAQCSAPRQPGRRITGEGPMIARLKLQCGPLLGVRHTSMRVRTTDAPGAEVQTLKDLQLGSIPGLQPGMYLDVLESGQRVAAHAAFYGYHVGRRAAVAAPDGSDQWRGTLDWRAWVTTFQLGGRVLPTLGTRYVLLAGAGAEISRYWIRGNVLRYGSGQASTRQAAGNLERPTFQKFELGFGNTVLPYLELGIQRGRLTVLLTGRVYGKEQFNDGLTVSTFYPNPPPNPYGTNTGTGYRYSARTISTAVVVSYQLNHDPAQPK